MILELRILIDFVILVIEDCEFVILLLRKLVLEFFEYDIVGVLVLKLLKE